MQEHIIRYKNNIISLNYTSRSIHASFYRENTLENTYVTKDLTNSTFSERASSVYIPSSGKPFYRSIKPDIENVTILKETIDEFQQTYLHKK
jgi:hypothetical protein